jgi:hypothetical protein
VDRFVDDAGLQPGRPVHKGRNAHTPLVEPALAAAEGGVVGGCLGALFDAANLAVALAVALRTLGIQAADRAAQRQRALPRPCRDRLPKSLGSG